MLIINVGFSVNINDLYNNTEKTKKFWLKWKKKREKIYVSFRREAKILLPTHLHPDQAI